MTEHTYPSNYPPGTNGAIDEAWQVLDLLTPGQIPDEVRFFLAGVHLEAERLQIARRRQT